MSALWSPKAIGRRLPGWDRAALAVVAHHMALPITWGLSDCLTVPTDLCEAMTGVVILPAHLRKYRTAEGAYRLLFKMGFNDIEEALTAAFTPIAPAMARRFDAGIVERTVDGKPVLATVIIGSGGHAQGRDELGPVLVPALTLRSAFAIGARIDQAEAF